MANLVELVKQAALEAVAAAHPAQAVFGKVTDTEPLAVRIHQKLRLTAEFLALSETVRTKLAAKSLRPATRCCFCSSRAGSGSSRSTCCRARTGRRPPPRPSQADIAGKPAAFPPAPHAHTAAEVGGRTGGAHAHTGGDWRRTKSARTYGGRNRSRTRIAHAHRRGNQTAPAAHTPCRIRYCRRYASARTRRYGRGKRRRGAH